MELSKCVWRGGAGAADPGCPVADKVVIQRVPVMVLSRCAQLARGARLIHTAQRKTTPEGVAIVDMGYGAFLSHDFYQGWLKQPHRDR